MECNKDEAIRAKQIAENKMKNGDFLGAQKFARKAQQLYPELDNVSQMLTVCEVHCSAQNKILGSEMDWYGILQIDRLADEATIKKQYRKLALLLHPDKNKFSGAEAAFKLIGEANRMLSDKTKRSVYDLKFRASTRTSAPNTGLQAKWKSVIKEQYGAASNFPNGPPQHGAPNAVPKTTSQFTGSHPFEKADNTTFWTSCSACGIRYQYYRTCVNRILRCQSCQQSFTAYDLGTKGVPLEFPWSRFQNQNGVLNPAMQNGFPNPGPSKVAAENNGGKPSTRNFSDKFTRFDPVSNAANASQAGGISKTQEKVDCRVDVKEGVGANGKEGSRMPNPNGGKPSKIGTSRNSIKRKRKSTNESDESCETRNGDEDMDLGVQDNRGHFSGQSSGFDARQQLRRSSRQKQNFSYKENHSDDEIPSSSKTLKGSKPSLSGDEDVQETGVPGGVSKGSTSASFVDGNQRELKQKGSSFLESLPNKKNKTGELKAEKTEADISGHGDKKAPNPEIIEYPDPDFNDFDKDRAENCFGVNQIWAVYDTCDGMPRFYARIRKVFSPGFKLQINWLEPDPDDESETAWCDVDLPIACGKFTAGSSEETEDHLMFSHQISWMKGSGRGSYLIYPLKGETWAIFRDWDIKWSSDPDKHRPPHQYEFVEILTDFNETVGIGVAYLGKVKGFVSLFQQTAQHGVTSFHIAPTELYRFSHRIPSFRMTGKERYGVPAGSYEFDPASLPINLNRLDDSGNVKMEFENLVTEPNGSCPKSAEGREKSVMDSRKITTPKKPERENLMLRRSPRDLGKKNDQVNSRQHTIQEEVNKHSDGKKVKKQSSILQFMGSASSSQSDDKTDDKMHLHARYGSSTSVMETFKAPRSPSGAHKIPEPLCHDFKAEKSEDKFQFDQIWALYSDTDGMPKNYAQVKIIELNPDFRLHVVPLEACLPSKDPMQPICCGTFKVKNGKTKVLSRSGFSHRVKAVAISRNIFEIYPRKGEVWAVYKNCNSELADAEQLKGECDIVEILEEHEQSIKVVVLSRINGSNSLYKARRIQRSKIGLMEIPRADLNRFSYQIPAFQQTGERDIQPNGCWNLDPSAIPGTIIID
ncbi:DnaJ domain containing protein [Melia azedarach]|uniref:DnaJ domain containing protein n=1 Tax=Melia azedarach TaxID=155640 RepID=A0ACC1Y746_MELAZ|nr:DnaJ domain containing protein [Melia azedarach]